MAGTVKFYWNKKPTVERVNIAAHRTMERLRNEAHMWWLAVVPVGKDTKHHRAGQLRDSWFAYLIDMRTGVALIFGASAPYAIYVELGTGKMPPRAPIRTTAGEVFPFIATHLREELVA